MSVVLRAGGHPILPRTTPGKAPGERLVQTKMKGAIVSNDDFFGGTGSKYFPFPTIGTTITGVVFEEPTQRQQTEIKTGEPLSWPDGNPKMVMIIPLQTELRDNADDEGKRSVWVTNPSGMRTAIAKALKEAGLAKPKPADLVGGTLTLTYVKDGERAGAGLNPPKIFTAVFEPAGDSFLSEPAAPASNGSAPAAPAGIPTGVEPAVWATLSPEAQAAWLNLVATK